MSKVKIGELINSLVSDVESIDNSDRPQGEKTKKIKAVALKFKKCII
ncbi:hypothetical protein NO386_25920 [Escherichia coli]|nr:hypothetical protein [Escherichia coli]